MASSSVVQLDDSLLEEVTGENSGLFDRVSSLDLNLKRRDGAKIRVIRGLDSFSSLTVLNLSYNTITRIEGLAGLRNLRELNLAENGIKKIENLNMLRKLEYLNLSGNSIRRVPEDISALANLKTLRLARNDLEVVKDLGNLSSLLELSQLRIDGNPISKLSATSSFAIYSVKSLASLDGKEVTAEQRLAALKMFERAEVSELRKDIATEVPPTTHTVARAHGSNLPQVRRYEQLERELRAVRRESELAQQKPPSEINSIEQAEYRKLLAEKTQVRPTHQPSHPVSACVTNI